jgi:hypothetical protein
MASPSTTNFYIHYFDCFKPHSSWIYLDQDTVVSRLRAKYTDLLVVSKTMNMNSAFRLGVNVFSLPGCLFVCFHGRPWQATDVPQTSWLIVPPALDVPTLATRYLRVYRRVPHSSGGSWNLRAGNENRQFSLNSDFHGTFRDLLHASNLRHGTHGFTSLPKEGVLRIFPTLKIRRLRPGLNP